MDTQFFTSSTSMSSSSSSSSRKGSQECFSDFGIDKKSRKSKKSANRSSSFALGSVTEVSEDIEDYLMSRLPHFQMVNDNNEFRERIPPRLKRNEKYQKRRASLSPHGTNGLAKVEEVIGEDDELKNKCIFKLGLMLDKDEFNDKRRRLLQSKDRINIEKATTTNLTILEDAQENVKELQQHVMSPTYKLKVDEVDFEQEKKQWQPQEIIEVIEEEKPDNIVNIKEKEMFQKIKKILHEERDFLKRILKGELNKQEDIQKKQQFQSEVGETNWNQLIQEAEEQVNSDEDYQ
ncbi:unnamed protein product [Paramecium pentaurelia]|uniref:Uncharacterized protein n=1 Tax=Paramecium pentaurelia TaxID=43138 RepID=A0A8S1U6Z2_9CILI|nr:unnamed protein product [Paramecium pentaurelia]